MNRNIGKTDRIIRIVLGLLIVALGLLFGSWWGLVGLIPLLTATVRWCPAYRLLGLSTCETPRARPRTKAA